MAILLIHTGGTIGMAQTPDGFAPREGVVEDAVAALVASGKVTGEVEVLRLDPLIDSALATAQDWARIAQTIHQHRGRFDGFVVTHGTDTLAYTAAALCLALPGLAQPVIVTGAMRPLTVADTDGTANLIDALAAARTAPAGVWVQFGGKRLHGGRVRKAHSQALDAFTAAPTDRAPRVTAPDPQLSPLRPQEVALLTVTPGFSAALLDHAATTCDGIVLRCFGAGTVPDSPALRAALGKAQGKGVPVVAVSQCAEGGMQIGTYAAGKALRDSGVVDGGQMTAEAAFVKIHLALSCFAQFDAQHAYLAADQCGEMAE
ncbi:MULTISPECIES: asparaginase [unclassified Sulfitobacter]|uniref:asparaginase n=1 Tax=unclassified Sulfitobacter TaxID=196795 RepID=UPI0004E3056B|nr:MULTISPECIES: asparaginase [unclassified Sulfitobacter]PTA98418.1 asparaginase [Sulfitobacter sp. CB-A]ULO19456.1 asparaginase [Sulfitobacter sp. CB2047]